MAPTSCFNGQVHRLPDAPEAYGAMITRPKAAPAQSRSAALEVHTSALTGPLHSVTYHTFFACLSDVISRADVHYPFVLIAFEPVKPRWNNRVGLTKRTDLILEFST